MKISFVQGCNRNSFSKNVVKIYRQCRINHYANKAHVFGSVENLGQKKACNLALRFMTVSLQINDC